MAFSSIFHWKRFNLLLTLTFLTVFRTESSPVDDTPEKDPQGTFCPKGWYHYQKFCMTEGKGATEEAVAFYCAGFGGIGIKGICITKAKNSDSPDDPHTAPQRRGLLRLSLGLLNSRHPSSHRQRLITSGSDQNEAPLSNEVPDTMASILDGNDHYEDKALEERICPTGWSHHRNMCIYRTETTGQECHLMGAIELGGLCIKHADTEGLSSSEFERLYKLGKRVCCCNHVRARGNHYSC